MTTEGKPRDPKSAYSDPSANADKEGNPLMVRNFGPLIDQAKNCV